MIILELGGNPARSKKTLELYNSFPEATVVLSGVENPSPVMGGCQIDNEAVDTLTNFICTKKWISKGETVFLVTDHQHVFRCLGLSRIVWGKDVTVIPCTEGVIGGCGHESMPYCILDWLRALIWKITRITIVRQPSLKILFFHD